MQMPSSMNYKIKPSPSAAMFEKVLRAFETRGITYSDVLARLRRLLATGASPSELLTILRRRDSTERMPEYARVDALLVEAVERRAAQASAAPQGSAAAQDGAAAQGAQAPHATARPEPTGAAATERQAADEAAVDLEFDAGKDLGAPAGMRASELDLSVLARHLREVEERTAARGAASLETLTSSYERAKAAETAALERAAKLAAELEAVSAALQAERDKVQRLEQEIARSAASGEAAREAQLRESQSRDVEAQHYAAELRALRESLAARDASLEQARQSFEQARQSLEERDSRIEALGRDHAALEASLAAHARVASDMEADLRAAREHAEAVTAQLRSTEAAATLDARRADAPAPAAAPAPLRRSSARHAGSAWAILGAAAAALLVGAGWRLAHRAPAPPKPVAAAASLPSPGTVIRDCPTCPEMTVLPTGRFKQGTADGPAVEQPLHWVVIRRPIAMSTGPVTVEDFERFAAATGRDMQGCDTYDGEWKHHPEDSWERPGFVQTGAHPVTCVSWVDAEAYAAWLSSKTGHHYRLPSASEWEYAARAGADLAQPWGANEHAACAAANVADAAAERRYPGWTVFPCDDGYVYTAPVGAFPANAFGLHDMLGNVLQWTEDCWHESYAGAPVDGSARLDGDCSVHEVRGASWFSAPAYVRTSYRDRFPADYRASTLGIRLVRDVAS